MKALKLEPEIVVKNGKAEAVILKMHDYEELLEKIEDAEDLRWLKEARKRTLRFRGLDEVLADANARV